MDRPPGLGRPITGRELGDLRRTYGLTQADLAARLGVNRVTVANWEAAERVPTIKAERYRRAAEDLAREAMIGTADLVVVGA